MCKEIGKDGRGIRVLTQEELESGTLDTKLIGERIKAARKLRGITQEQLAEAANCTHTHICNLENGKIGISLELLFRISVVLQKSLDYFVMDNVHANPQTKIDDSIAPKLSQCDPHMLTVVDGLLDTLLTYQDRKEKQIKKELQELK